MEERRGESISVTMERERAGVTEAVTKRCDMLGIDPAWSLPERAARMVDIEQGSGRTSEEVVRSADYSRAQVSTEFFGKSKKTQNDKKETREDIANKRKANEEQLIKDSKYTSNTMRKLADYMRLPEVINENQDFDVIFGALPLANEHVSKLSEGTKKYINVLRSNSYLSEHSNNLERAAELAADNARKLAKMVQKDVGGGK